LAGTGEVHILQSHGVDVGVAVNQDRLWGSHTQVGNTCWDLGSRQ
jgi:hypothetical protein